MTKPKKPDPNLISQRQFAKELGVYMSYVSKLVKQRKIILEKGKVNRTKAIATMKLLSDPARKSVFSDGETSRQEIEDKQDPKNPMMSRVKSLAATEHYRAEMLRLKYEELDGRLVDREKFMEALTTEIAKMLMVVKKSFLLLPVRASRQCHIQEYKKELKTMLTKEIREILTELSVVDLTKVGK